MYTNEDFDIIIEGGQSNAEGSGKGPVTKYAEYVPNDKVVYMHVVKEITIADGIHVKYPDKDFYFDVAAERESEGQKVGDLALTFAEDYIKNGMLKDGRKILIIRGAIGGTSFNLKQWGVDGSVYSKMIEMTDYALKLNPKNKVVAFLWHQGEGDTNHTPADIYHQKMEALLHDVRFRYGEMPFVAGDFVPEWIPTRLENCLGLARVYRKIAEENTKSVFVESDGLLSNNQMLNNGDNIHFCREALYELGHRYFAAYADMIK